MCLHRFFYERPFLARNETPQENEGFRYAFGVLVGLTFWLRHEMSLLHAWGVTLFMFAAIIGMQYAYLLTVGTPWSYALQALGLALLIAFSATFFVSMFVFTVRLTDMLSRGAEVAGEWTGKAWHAAWDPARDMLSRTLRPYRDYLAHFFSRMGTVAEQCIAWLTNTPWGVTVLGVSFGTVVGFLVWKYPDHVLELLRDAWADLKWFIYLAGALLLLTLILSFLLVVIKYFFRKKNGGNI